jgi:hypothetical protein
MGERRIGGGGWSAYLKEEGHDGEGEHDGGDDGDVLGSLGAGIAAVGLLAVAEDGKAEADGGDNEAGDDGDGAEQAHEEEEHQEGGVAPVGANEARIEDHPARLGRDNPRFGSGEDSKGIAHSQYEPANVGGDERASPELAVLDHGMDVQAERNEAQELKRLSSGEANSG